jgi:glycosyltransferase involved in cell wall biosynthesis
LRIAHLTATFPPYPGGAGNTCFRFAIAQAERGHHVEVFTAPADGEPPDPGAALIHRLDPVLAIGNAPLIPSLARIEGFDLLHLHYPFIFGSELTLLGRLRPRQRRQALLVHYKNRLVGKGARRAAFAAYEHSVAPVLIGAADRVCVLSAQHADSVPYLRRAGERRPEKLIQMPNGVDTEVFAPGSDELGLRASLGIGEGSTVIGFAATLDRAHHFKRLDLALAAVTGLGDDDVHLVVAGGGELEGEFRDQAARLGIAERVHFLGTVPHTELPGVLRACDLFLLTTEPPESFGIVLIEAMAAGAAVVASDLEPFRDVAGEAARFFPPGDHRALADHIVDLLAHPASRDQLSLAGSVMAAGYDWSIVGARYKDVYQEAVS